MSNLTIHKWLTGVIIMIFYYNYTLVIRLFLYKFVLKYTQRRVLRKTVTWGLITSNYTYTFIILCASLDRKKVKIRVL